MGGGNLTFHFKIQTICHFSNCEDAKSNAKSSQYSKRMNGTVYTDVSVYMLVIVRIR